MSAPGARKKKNKNRSLLVNQIRLSYLILLLPNIVFMVYAFYNIYIISERYNDMLNSVTVASEFSLDFKNDFDYETYLLIVGNVTPEESGIPKLLADAGAVVESLEEITDTAGNRKRLESARKYLSNLSGYIDNIIGTGCIAHFLNDIGKVNSLYHPSVFPEFRIVNTQNLHSTSSPFLLRCSPASHIFVY